MSSCCDGIHAARIEPSSSGDCHGEQCGVVAVSEAGWREGGGRVVAGRCMMDVLGRPDKWLSRIFWAANKYAKEDLSVRQRARRRSCDTELRTRTLFGMIQDPASTDRFHSPRSGAVRRVIVRLHQSHNTPPVRTALTRIYVGGVRWAPHRLTLHVPLLARCPALSGFTAV